MLGLSVGLVLADSSVVTIALPEILARYDVEIATLAWALTSYNLALALAASPGGTLARRRRSGVFAVGIVLFAGASLACAFASTFELLVAARAAQGAAGAAVVCGALALLADVAGGDAPAACIWALAGVIGAALGPAAGGILTQLLGWESIFLVQAPVVLCALLTLHGARVVPASQPIERPHLAKRRAAGSRARSSPRSSCS